MARPIDVNDVLVEFKIPGHCGVPIDPHEFILEVDGEILLRNEDLSPKKRLLGKCQAYIFQLDKAYEYKQPIMEIFDTVDSDIFDYFSLLFKNGRYSPLVSKIGEPGSGPDLLIIDRVEIFPPHRGQKLGLAAAYSILETFGGQCAYAVVRPFPLQFGLWRDFDKTNLEKHLGSKLLKCDEHEATEKLRVHWGKLGFKRLGDTDVFALSTAYKRPTIMELIGLDAARNRA